MTRILALRMLTVGALPALALAVSGFQLPSHKDKLFAYANVLERSAGGDDLVVEYKPSRDYYGRDAEPPYKAKWKYVSRGVRWHRKSRRYKGGAGSHPVYVVGKAAKPRVAVVFIHGKNGSHRSGVRDRVVGGNFNRLQNLMVKGNGRYYSPTFSDFRAGGVADMTALIKRIEGEAPGAPVVLACTSTGAALCLRLARNAATKSKIDGLMLLGGSWDDKAVGAVDFPVVIGHGSKDKVYPLARMHRFARDLRKGGQKVRFIEFRYGYHGTPLRMVDWRGELNWILAQQ